MGNTPETTYIFHYEGEEYLFTPEDLSHAAMEMYSNPHVLSALLVRDLAPQGLNDWYWSAAPYIIFLCLQRGTIAFPENGYFPTNFLEQVSITRETARDSRPKTTRRRPVRSQRRRPRK